MITELHIPEAELVSGIVANSVDLSVLIPAVIEAYSLYPYQANSFIKHAVTIIYNKLSYSTTDAATATSNIGAYTDESVLLTDLLLTHANMSTLLLSKLDTCVNNILFKECVGGLVVFDVKY